jgi:hypothetical protein
MDSEHARKNYYITKLKIISFAAALSDGGSEEMFGTLSLELGVDDQSSQRNELHTP